MNETRSVKQTNSQVPERALSAGESFRVGLIAGAAAGVVADLVLFPLDTLKTRLQVQGARFGAKTLQGIYSGVVPAIAASAPAAAAFFGTYDWLKRTLSLGFPQGAPPLIHMFAAAGGDLAGSVVRVPFEVVKQNLQAGYYRSSVAAVKAIVAKEGVRGLYRGWGSLIAREIPFDVLEFPLYEAFKKMWSRHKGRSLDTWESALCGSAAGGIAAACTTPLDVVKTRLMTQSVGAQAYQGIWASLQRIAREEGVGTLFSGTTPRVLWISLGGALFFGGYEATKSFLTEPPKLPVAASTKPS
jgi:solute carrier family 25 S-adenosylmethionine transporter 26